jgi:hypothetical protein
MLTVPIRKSFPLAAALLFLGTVTAMCAGPLAHSHNDYEQARPLSDALAHGFDSIEADVWLLDGKLLVAHERAQVQPTRTLESLYLEPLRAQMSRDSSRSLILLIDVKTEAASTWRSVEESLGRYPELAARVRCIVSGNRAPSLMAAQPGRKTSMDGRIEDLDDSAPADLIPLISDNWAKNFTWRGAGEFPSTDSCGSGIPRTSPQYGGCYANVAWISSAPTTSPVSGVFSTHPEPCAFWSSRTIRSSRSSSPAG